MPCAEIAMNKAFFLKTDGLGTSVFQPVTIVEAVA